MTTLRIIQSYYLGSPLFFLVGLWWGVELRTVFLPDPLHRFLYYLALSALGVLTYLRPASAPWVAMGESALNLLLLVAGILLPIYGLAERALAGAPLTLPYSPGEILVNGLLAGSFFLLGFYRGQAAAQRQVARWIRGEGPKGPGRTGS